MTGGIGSNDRQLDSTEVMVDFTAWREAAKLPSQRFGLRAATVDNKVFIFGITIKLPDVSLIHETLFIQVVLAREREGTPFCSTTPTPGSPQGR